MVKPSDQEEEYFARQELERRKKAEQERQAAMAVEERERLRELHYMKCPKCGMDLTTIEMKGIQLDRCVSCGGTWFDGGEMEQMMGQEQGVMDRIFSVFRSS